MKPEPSNLTANPEPPTPQELASVSGSVRRIVVTQSMVNEIVRRAKDSQWGLSEEAKASLSLLFYEAAPMDALALVLVNGWEAKYDLVSIFSAALSVVEEKAQNKLGER